MGVSFKVKAQRLEYRFKWVQKGIYYAVKGVHIFIKI